jgi:rhodanese-related sulfurtransferase
MTASTTITAVSATELAERLRTGTVAEFWNALTDAYFTGELIPGSRRVPVDQVGREVARTGLAKDTPIVVYCSGPACPNSRQAAEKLIAFGFTDVTLFEGGLEEWKGAGYGVEAASSRAE